MFEFFIREYVLFILPIELQFLEDGFLVYLMDVLMEAGNNWILMAFLAPFFWSLVNVVDVYFVGGTYRDEVDGSVISSLFQIVPWLFLFPLLNFGFFQELSFQEKFSFFSGAVLLFFGGILFSISFYFYFKALFNWNDAAIIQIVVNFAVILVPLIAFLIFKERLENYKYAGMLWIFFGAFFLSFNPKIKLKLSKKYAGIVMAGVIFLSMSLVLENKAYSILSGVVPDGGFWLGFLFFSLGCLFWGMALALFKRRNVFPMAKKFWKIFLFAEGVSFLGTVASQRALDITPSVSFVSAIEALSPVFIMIFSFLILFYNYIFKKKNDLLNAIYEEQISGVIVKTISVFVMAYGVYLLGI